MPFFEIAFMEVAPEVFGAEVFGAEAAMTDLAAAEAASALAPSLLGAAEMSGLGAAGAESAGITQAGMAADAAAGGAGAGGAGINAAQVAAQQNAAMQLANPGITSAVTSPVSGFQPVSGFEGVTSGPQGASPNFFNPSATVAPGQGPLPTQYQLNAPNASQSLRLGSSLESSLTAPQMTSVLQPPSALENGFNTAAKFAKENPFMAMTGAYMGANALGLLNPSGATFNNAPYSGPLSKYKLAENFQGRTVNPLDYQYRPRYAEGGGIMGAMPQIGNNIPVGYDEGGMAPEVPSYASGGSLSDSIAQYQKMLGGQQQAAPAASRDVGIYYDLDPDTRYQDALTAAQIRQAKVNQRAYVSPPAAKRPTPMGKLNMPTSSKSKDSGDVEAAHGGIMHSSLGGYAAGGNPRLLKGPGDGMSDNIPATINGRQPARLADGEFVVPADVVSHLGNGSTDAGAKQLHGMMDKVRKARTGNPKQGKNIKPQKYMPK